MAASLLAGARGSRYIFPLFQECPLALDSFSVQRLVITVKYCTAWIWVSEEPSNDLAVKIIGGGSSPRALIGTRGNAHHSCGAHLWNFLLAPPSLCNLLES